MCVCGEEVSRRCGRVGIDTTSQGDTGTHRERLQQGLGVVKGDMTTTVLSDWKTKPEGI